MKSILFGAGISYSYVHYYKSKYIECIDETYDRLKDKFVNNPMLSTMKEDDQIIKNFGFAKSNDDDYDEDDEEMDAREIGIFEGTPEMERNEYKQRVMDFIYGKWL